MAGVVTRCILAAALIGWITPGAAQGVTTPAPGSLPAATGPNSINPSAAASDLRNPSAVNPSAAPSSTSSNVLNPSATPSTFAPVSRGPIASRPPDQPSPALRLPLRRTREARPPRRGRAAQRQAVSREAEMPERARRGERTQRSAARRARAIVDSVCRGC